MTVRGLTGGESAIVRSMFGESLAIAAITLRRAKYWLAQPAWVTMAPDGNIWFHPNGDSWCADFATEPLGMRALLVHELVHVWQRQRGINLLLRRMPWATYRYLPLIPGKPFTAYGIEQQACIVQDAYVLREGGTVGNAPRLEVYQALWPHMA